MNLPIEVCSHLFLAPHGDDPYGVAVESDLVDILIRTAEEMNP